MKPKYKLHQEITELSKWKLPHVYPDQIHWGYDNCLDKLCHLSRGKMYCLECGHSWKPENKRKIQVCPECDTRLSLAKDYRSYRNDATYMSVVTTCDGYQVVRMIWVSKLLKMNSPAQYFGREVMQHWIDDKGNHTTMSLAVNGLSQACDSWIFSSEMKVREYRGYYSNTQFRHNLSPYKTFPKAQILPVYKRNGFKGDLHGLSPLVFFKELLNNQRFETLLKARQYYLLGICKDGATYGSIWTAIKICIRNKYIVQDAKMWKDYLYLLQYFRKDLHNAYYVCPKNLKESHDQLVERKRRIQQREKLEKQREKLETDQIKYAKQKSKFFGIRITDGKLMIKTLETVEEVMKEGDALHHCVYTNNYHLKPESLILSARIDNKPIETIEISLKNFEVVQSRGLQNKSSDYHDQIISLVRKNIKVIQEKKSVKRQKLAV